MMFNMRDLPIKAKLVAMMTITTSVSILFMATVFLINEAINKHDAIITELSTLAKVIGSQSTGAIEFNDVKTAEENLNALSTKQNVIYAAILQKNGQVLAEYKTHPFAKANSQQAPFWFITSLQQLSMGNLTDTIKVSKAIFLDDQRIGEIQIVSSLTPFYINLINYLCWVGIIVLACFGLGLAVSTRLHKLISAPILELDRATKRVSQSKTCRL